MSISRLKTKAFKALCFVVICLGSLEGLNSCSDEYKYDDDDPSWLSSSIYEYLKSQGNFTNYLRLVDDLNYKCQLVPANETTGKLLTFSNLSATLHSTDPASMSYTMKKPTSCTNIEVGVQAIAPDYNASEFTKVRTSITAGISTISKGVGTSTVDVYSLDGKTIAKNVSADKVNQLNKGVYILKSGKTITKIVKK